MSAKVRARAIATGEFEFGLASTGSEQVGIAVRVLEGEFDGRVFTWYGHFTEAAVERTIEALKHAGWNGEDFANLPGLGSREFQLTLTEEQNQRGELFWRASFINPIGVAMKNKMDNASKASLAKRIAAFTGKPSAPVTKKTVPF